MKCKHKRTKTGEPRGYTGSVAIYSPGRRMWLSEENRAAHGGICVTITCLDCGATRQENRNGRHVEEGPWWTEEGYES